MKKVTSKIWFTLVSCILFSTGSQAFAQEESNVQLRIQKSCGIVRQDSQNIYGEEKLLVFDNFKSPSPIPHPVTIYYSNGIQMPGRTINSLDVLNKFEDLFFKMGQNGNVLNSKAAKAGVLVELEYIVGNRQVSFGKKVLEVTSLAPFQVLDFKVLDNQDDCKKIDDF